MAKGDKPTRDRKIEWPKKENGDGEAPAADANAPRPVPPVVPPVAKPLPPVAQPVAPARPPVAQPVPPVAKPVAPARPPVAQPVPPVAKPVRPGTPPVAQPVAPVAQPVAPVARPVAPAARPAASASPASTSRSARRGAMAEEEVGRSGRSGRGARSARPEAGGMSIALKTALTTAALALGVLAIAVLAGGRKDDVGVRELDTAGLAAAQRLASVPASVWTGERQDSDPVKTARDIVVDLFGDRGKEFWDAQAGDAQRSFTDEMDQEEINQLKEAKQRWQEAVDKWKNASGDSGSSRRVADALLGNVRAMADATGGSFRVLGAWIRDVKGNQEYVAADPAPGSIVYNDATLQGGQTTGKIGGYDVRIFAAPVSGTPRDRPMRAYVAFWESAPAGDPAAGNGVGLAMLILGPLLVGGLGYAIANAHTRNVRELAREIDKLGTKGDPSRALRVRGGEAGSVARAVERMVSNLEFRNKHGDDDLEQIVDRERKVADEIHGALISKNPPRLSNYEVETLFKPGFEIGGDHFEYFPIDEHHLGVILLDTNVRGLTAALVMASARSYVRAHAPGVTSPAEVLRRVNVSLAGELPPGRHVTAMYVVIDTREGKATVASAGHLPLIVYRHATGKVAKVNPEGIALGLDVGPVFDKALQEGDIPINVGDRIVLYTDGALKIQNEEGEEFGESSFYATVAREAPKNSQAFVNFVGGAIDQFHLNTPQNDDITISTVKRLR